MSEAVEQKAVRAKQKYYAVVKLGSAEAYEIKTSEVDTQRELKKLLESPEVVEIVSITKGRKVSFKETRSLQLTLGE